MFYLFQKMFCRVNIGFSVLNSGILNVLNILMRVRRV